ncbi:helix-turn-helix transcriptional regulator [Sedimentibacter sp. zth1]|uniref:helix-turn-helix domain-containing protein n=1 Tax=Sedimentibacter sp. zth1 TaxID=2816908 RepID=UPI001A91B978|nr:helix-turn-helix transcriptional regulator [Sedimentibacter sp. zth1]QSX05247.1 helix-turn-helix transcriptional regulator [Sedimentibacter sp. zth1]
MESNFGSILKQLRKKYNLTQKELSEGICSVKQLIRIEHNDSEPSIYVLHRLSSKLNIDLNEYYKKIYNNNIIEAIEYSDQIINCIGALNFEKLYSLIKIVEKHSLFRSGQNLALLYYAKAAYEFHTNKRYDMVIELCQQGIQAETPSFKIQNTKQNIYSNLGYSMLNLISCCYRELNEEIKCINILLYILDTIDKFYFSESYQSYNSMTYTNKLYQATLFQLGKLYYYKNDYNTAFSYINKGIDFSFKNNMTRLLPELFEMKYLTLYRLERYNEALVEYRCAKHLYKNAGFPQFAVDMENTARNKFPKIIELDNL